MKKFNNKKGFTIVELVIVIAVIGILAGVLIPTFSGIVQRANESKINQEMTNALKVVLAGNATSGALANGTTFVMSQKNDENKDVAAYYAEYNGNKFDKIVTINAENPLDTTRFDRVIIGTKKDGSPYETTVKAIANLYGLAENTTVTETTNGVSKIGDKLTVLTNSDLSEGMFVLVPKDGAVSTTTVTVTVDGDAVKTGETAVLSNDKTTVTIAAAEGVNDVNNVNNVDGYTITVNNGTITIKKADGNAFTVNTTITVTKK